MVKQRLFPFNRLFLAHVERKGSAVVTHLDARLCDHNRDRNLSQQCKVASQLFQERYHSEYLPEPAQRQS